MADQLDMLQDLELTQGPDEVVTQITDRDIKVQVLKAVACGLQESEHNAVRWCSTTCVAHGMVAELAQGLDVFEVSREAVQRDLASVKVKLFDTDMLT